MVTLPPPARPRVLIVDDEMFIARAAGCILESARGAETHVVGDGAEALAQARISPPDLILVDVHMPGMTALDLCRGLRQVPGLAETPLYLFTGLLPQSEEVGELLRLVCGVIGKPPDPGELIQALDMARRVGP